MCRLEALAPFDDAAHDAFRTATQRSRTVQPRQELLTEGRAVGEPSLLLDGWAARIRHLADGRRQILNFTLPGDLVGLCDHERPIASATIVAITPVRVCPLPDRAASPALDRAYAMSRAVEEAYLMAQITRLGRLNAFERIADMLLELHERLSLAGLAAQGRFAMPLTQEIIADALGLTSVHVNRMLKQARRADELRWSGKEVTLTSPDALARSTGRHPIRVAQP